MRGVRRFALAACIALAGLTASPSASASQPIEGRWSMGGGVLELHPDGQGFSNRWLEQRPGMGCPRIDDQDGDMRLRGQGRSYTGTWRWVLRSSSGRCSFVGLGPMTVVVSEDGRKATIEADAPAGWVDHESHELTRIAGGPPLRLAKLTEPQQTLLRDALQAARRQVAVSLVESLTVQLAAVRPLRRYPLDQQAPFAR